MGEETIRRAASAFKLPPEPLSDERESLALSLLAPIAIVLIQSDLL
jgi:hypothetical protein